MPRSSLRLLFALALIAHLPISTARADDAIDVAQMQIREQVGPLFESAAQEFSVPADLLRAYAFVHTRWSVPLVVDDPNHTPAIYGIMGLHDGREGWFINQVGRAAELLGVPEDQVRQDLRTNVRAAAALLSQAAREWGIQGEALESWVPAVEAISAIPVTSPVDRFARKTEAYDVLDVLRRGYEGNGIRIVARPLDLRRAFSGSDLNLMRAPTVSAAELEATGSDYPPALWNPTTCFESRAGAATTHITIHTMQGYYASTISWFKNCRNGVSAHYLVRSSDGQITQMVHEVDMAWHVRASNPYTVGIEHEGFISDPVWYTKEMYEASATLVRDLCVRHGIDPTKTYGGSFQGPLSDIEFKVKGHVHFAGQTHTDPGSNWDWPRYRALVLGAPERDASILKDESAVPAKLAPGSAQTVRVRVLNTGSSPWKAGEGYRLGAGANNGVVWSAFGCGGYMNTPRDGRAFLCADVPPGGVVDFVFNVTAPASGPASLSVRMVRDGVAWFGASASWPIAVEVPIAIRYRGWIQNAADWQPWASGWSGDPASVDELAGTVGQGLRLEALAALVEGSSGAGVCYQAHVQNLGWQAPVCDGGTAGIVSSGLRIEAVKAWLRTAPAGVRLCYRAHVQNMGWMGEVCDGAQAGTTGQSLRLEALQIRIVR